MFCCEICKIITLKNICEWLLLKPGMLSATFHTVSFTVMEKRKKENESLKNVKAMY